uniref:NAM-associated domain-containing protein n=1 Tax=Parastrongyloides trichosuri TaxID=131310 RepID=A0A0N4ZQP8_PARTI
MLKSNDRSINFNKRSKKHSSNVLEELDNTETGVRNISKETASFKQLNISDSSNNNDGVVNHDDQLFLKEENNQELKMILEEKEKIEKQIERESEVRDKLLCRIHDKNVLMCDLKKKLIMIDELKFEMQKVYYKINCNISEALAMEKNTNKLY